jgi:hypothetical protein
MDHGAIEIIRDPVTRAYLAEKAAELFGDMLKAVVDTQRRFMAVGGELHADEERTLLEAGSSQSHLWGINLYVEMDHPDWIEFDSMINLRPNQGNRTRGVDDPAIRAEILEIVANLVQP